jgi:predicted Zn-dependent protease
MTKYDIRKEGSAYVLYEISPAGKRAVASNHQLAVLQEQKKALEAQQRILG